MATTKTTTNPADTTVRYEMHDLDGAGPRRTRVYAMPAPTQGDYWTAVTDVPCPIADCTGTIRWAEAGYVPGYRICDGCGRHFLARGTVAAPTLLRFGSRRGRR